MAFYVRPTRPMPILSGISRTATLLTFGLLALGLICAVGGLLINRPAAFQ
jgi:hypothetical protein